MAQVVVSSWGCIPDSVERVPEGADGTAFLREVALRETDMLPEGAEDEGGVYIAFGDWEFRLMDLEG